MSLLEIPASQYHADELGDQPTLSASIAKVLIGRSPKHAWTQHPRLNPDFKRDTDDKFSIGICAHALLLEGESRIEVVSADNWRTKIAQEQRADAYEDGRIPLLLKDAASVQDMVDAAKAQLAVHEASPPLFVDGKPEQTLVWTENGVSCRARLDWLNLADAIVDDYKTTSRSADPASWTRTSIFAMGHDIQAAFYLRGYKAVTTEPGEFRWCVQETSPPYALSVITPGADVLALANDKIDTALRVWRHCLETDSWPAYDPRVATAELPAWEETRWLEKTLIEDAA